MKDKAAFCQVDVFTDVPFMGNPVAVILDGDRFAPSQMQRIARWTNLSETTFVCSPSDPEADYLLRIFTPKSELGFAGHPTIGSARAVQHDGRAPKNRRYFVQQCARGLVKIRAQRDLLLFELPKPVFSDVDPATIKAMAQALGVGEAEVIVAQRVDVGVSWLTMQIGDADRVRGLRPDLGTLSRLTPENTVGLTVFGLEAPETQTQIEVRSFAPAEGIDEDPVCGSGNGCVAALIQKMGLLGGDSYIARQGRNMGRDGRIEVRFDPIGNIWIGGRSVICIEGGLNASFPG